MEGGGGGWGGAELMVHTRWTASHLVWLECEDGSGSHVAVAAEGNLEASPERPRCRARISISIKCHCLLVSPGYPRTGRPTALHLLLCLHPNTDPA